ncbi:unnamed protein product [Dovyalis caffra]|uniref:RNase H type-1 domain-containing protein n=1 Tax=Dovyalis caffra TaxID=77055 RepID=A0AAV1RHR2_9ROSI|nr:unnamed protein product [Dovyalis caffra]
MVSKLLYYIQHFKKHSLDIQKDFDEKEAMKVYALPDQRAKDEAVELPFVQMLLTNQDKVDPKFVVFIDNGTSYQNIGSNNVGKASALFQGLQLCSELNLVIDIVELDSRLIVEVVKNSFQCPWSISYLIRKCKALLQGINIVHVLREGNSLANHLADHAYGHCSI